jgi:hypothetical protein
VASAIQTIAEGVKTALNAAPGGTFSQQFTATRKHAPLVDRKSLATLAVTVAARGEESERLERRGDQLKTLIIDIGIQKKITSNPGTEEANTELDPLDQLAEEIEDFFGPAIQPGAGATWVNTKRTVIADPAALNDDGIFFSLISITFQRT